MIGRCVVCLMPLLDGHVVEPTTLASLGTQTMPVRLVPVSRPPLEPDATIKPGLERRAAEAVTRNILRGLALREFNESVYLWIDSDVVLNDREVVRDMVAFLASHGEFGVVAVNCRSTAVSQLEDPAHTDIGCMLVRRHVLERIQRFSYRGGCCCVGFCRDLAGLRTQNRVRYLQMEPRARKVR